MATAEQRRNAQIIISVGRSVGASNRDILIALMTALQESSLRNLNYGNQDSVGLFQQRARGWASRSIRMDPVQSARMFFTGGYGGAPGLFSIKRRNGMSLTEAAQAVQRSAFPDAYARHESLARSLMGLGSAGATGVGTGSWVRPVRGGTMTNGYGVRNARYASGAHTGMDFAVPLGTPVYAAAAGRVVGVSRGGAYGLRIEIDHGGKIFTLSAHMSAASVRVGDQVQAGQMIGKSGNSGKSTGPHLHFEVRKGGNSYSNTVNPMDYLNGSATPEAYVRGDTYEEFTTVTPFDMGKINVGALNMDVALPKPYVYISPLEQFSTMPEGLVSSDPMEGLGTAEPLPQYSDLIEGQDEPGKQAATGLEKEVMV